MRCRAHTLLEQRNCTGQQETKEKGCSRQEQGNALLGAVAAAPRAQWGREVLPAAPVRAWPWAAPGGNIPGKSPQRPFGKPLSLVNHLPIRKHGVVSAKHDLYHRGRQQKASRAPTRAGPAALLYFCLTGTRTGSQLPPLARVAAVLTWDFNSLFYYISYNPNAELFPVGQKARLNVPQRRLELCEARSALGQRKPIPVAETQETFRRGCTAEESWQLNC